MFLLHVRLFALSHCSFGEWNYKTPQFQAGSINFPFLLVPPFFSAELHCKLYLQASQLFQTLWTTEVETCEESGWLTLHSPSIHSHYPCSLLPAEGEERRAAARLFGRGYYGVSVTVRRKTRWLKGRMPPELKAEGLHCVRRLMLGRVGEFRSKSWTPTRRRRPGRPHDENMKFLSEYSTIFTLPDFFQFCYRFLRLSLIKRWHFLSRSSSAATWLQRGWNIWFKLDPEACVYFLLLSPISPIPHHTQLDAFVSYFAQDVTHPRLLF